VLRFPDDDVSQFVLRRPDASAGALLIIEALASDRGIDIGEYDLGRIEDVEYLYDRLNQSALSLASD